MLHHTRGIALHSTKFSETSIIARIYTELFGLQSYLVKGIRSPRSKIKPALFQPMTLLDLTVYHKEKSTLQNIREAANHYPYQSISTDIRKSSVLLFMNELIFKTIKEVEPNQGLFNFLYENCIRFDQLSENIQLFPLWFSVHFSRFLGFWPSYDESPEKQIFNLKEGTFQAAAPDHDLYLDKEQSKLLKILMNSGTQQESVVIHPVSGIRYPFSYELRNELLEKVLLYYQLHLPGFHGILSHMVLHEVFS